MFSPMFSRLFSHLNRPTRRRQKYESANRARNLQLEHLETRDVPAAMFSPVAAPTVSDGGGLVLKDTPVYLIYWGSGWGTTTSGPTMAAIDDATQKMLSGPYLSALSQYRSGLGTAHFAGSVWDRSNPSGGFSSETLLDVVQNAYNSLGLKDPDDLEPTIPLYLVVTPPGVASGESGAGGYHTWWNEAHDEWFDWDDVYYGWIGNSGTLDSITTVLSHEVVESLTDPTTSDGITATTAGDGELSDGESQNYNYRVNGVLLQSYWSAQDQRYIVPDGNSQSVIVSSGVLNVGGDQRLNDFYPETANDDIVVDHNGSGAKVTLNGEVFQFEPNQITSIRASGGSGLDSFSVQRTLSNVPVTVDGGSGNDTVYVGGGNLDGMRATVTVVGGADRDLLFFVDNSTSFSDRYTVNSGTIVRTTPGNSSLNRTVNYSGLETVALYAQKGDNQITVSSVNASSSYALEAGSGTDTLIGRNVASTWSITAANAGTVGNITFAAMENLQAGSAADVFGMETAGSLSGTLNGGGGDDWLDYSKFPSTTGVTVNLGTGAASRVGSGAAGKVSSIEHVRGGQGSDTLTGNSLANILVGMGGNDTIVGGAGRDLLIGGIGGDSLQGGTEGDILVGGYTSYDTNNTALLAILKEWKSSGDYTSRVQNINTGLNSSRLNGSYLLKGSTVFDDFVADSLVGGIGTDFDLFFAKLGDSTDKELAETQL